MRINPITALPTYRTQNVNRKNYGTTPAFKSNQYERDVEQLTEQLREERNISGWKWFWGEDSKTRQEAERIIDKRNFENEIKRAQLETLNKANFERLNDAKIYMEQLRQQQLKNDALMEEFKKSHSETIIFQQQAMEAQARAAESLQQQVLEYQKAMREQQELQIQHEKRTQELLKEMEKARAEHDISMEKRYEKEIQRMRELFEAQMKSRAETIEKTRNLEEIFDKLSEVQKNKGFGRLAGYEEEKNILMNLVGNSIALEKAGHDIPVPNGILFFGPKGNGKSTFAKAFAEQLDCNFVKIENTLDPINDYRNLMSIVNRAQENFEKTNKRTIVQIDEFEDFAPVGSKINGSMKALLDEVSRTKHCTFFLTTNFPEKIDDILLRDGRVDIKVPLYPADSKTAGAILEHYGKKFADSSVNFEKLGEILTTTNNEDGSIFSNSRIKSIVTNYAEQFAKKVMSHSDFVESIKMSYPDIKKEALELFKKQIEIMKHV